MNKENVEITFDESFPQGGVKLNFSIRDSDFKEDNWF